MKLVIHEIELEQIIADHIKELLGKDAKIDSLLIVDSIGRVIVEPAVELLVTKERKRE